MRLDTYATMLATALLPRVVAAQRSAPTVPLCPGLTIVTAITQPQGDYESIKRIETVTPEAVRLRYSSYMPDPQGDYESTTTEHPPWVPFSVYRTVRVVDLDTAGSYLQQFSPVGVPELVRGSTALGTSRRVLRDIATGKPVRLTMFMTILPAAGIKDDGSPVFFGMDYRLAGEVTLVESKPVAIPVLLNDRPATLPAVHARGKFLFADVDLYFLDDMTNPLALRYRFDKAELRVIKINHACDAKLPAGAGGSTMSALEQSLAETGRAEVFSIFFAFNKDSLRDESTPTLETIARILRKHADWKLTIEGHTDNVGGSGAANLELSKRRAAAVKAALVKQYGIEAARLMTNGYGATRPRDTNDTQEGRARNRRVELVRS